MTQLLRLNIVLLFLIYSTWASAKASQQSIDDIIKLSGLAVQIEQYPAQIKAGFQQAQQQGTPIKPEELEALIKSVDTYISPAAIQSQIQASLQNKLSQQEAEKLLVWFKSAIGKEITLAEEKSSEPESQVLIMQNANELLADQERRELAQRLDKLVGATDMTMGIYEYSSIAVFSAISTAINPDAPLNIAPLRAQMSASAAQTRSQIERLITVSYVHAYKDIDMNKLEKYERFLGEPTTVKFNRTITSSMKQALETSISNWADSLAKIFKESRNQ